MLILLAALCLPARAATPSELGVFSGQVTAELMVTEPELVVGMRDELHVLGFSPDGKLAVLVEQADEAVGGYLWRFEVRDLRTDKLVGSRQWTDGTLEAIPDRDSLLAIHGAGFRQLAATHGVVLQPDLEVHPLPWTWQEHRYDVVFGALPAEVDVHHRGATVTVTADGLGSKKVGDVTWSAMDDCCGRPTAVLVKSPHEDRAALIVAAWDRGWEGPPHVLRHHVIGVHLTERFAPLTP